MFFQDVPLHSPIVEERSIVPDYLYKVVSVKDWNRSDEEVAFSSEDIFFVHLATEDELPHVLTKFWKGKEYVILKLDPARFTGRLEFETNLGGTTRYYHLYEGHIVIESVREVTFSN